MNGNAVGPTGETDHGGLSGLGDDDHTQYVLADGSRAISGAIAGSDPTASNHLATKGYVDGVVAGLTYLTAENIDTLAEINTILGDATLIDDSDPRLTDARDWTADIVSQAEAEAGTATTPRKWTAERVAQAIAALASGGGSGPVVATPPDVVTPGLTVETIAGQTAPAMEINSPGGSGGDLFKVDATGAVYTTKVYATANPFRINVAGLDTVMFWSVGTYFYKPVSSASSGVDLGSPYQFARAFFKNLRLSALATTDPGIVGEVWNDAGTLKISAG